jgi:hypothetical protein
MKTYQVYALGVLAISATCATATEADLAETLPTDCATAGAAAPALAPRRHGAAQGTDAVPGVTEVATTSPEVTKGRGTKTTRSGGTTTLTSAKGNRQSCLQR